MAGLEAVALAIRELGVRIDYRIDHVTRDFEVVHIDRRFERRQS
jgi:hypothetical protein